MNNEYYVAKAKEARLRKVEKFNKIKSQPCVDCGNRFHPCAMDFDHISDDKTKNVSWLLNNRSWGEVLKEIEKCELVCSNCHRVRTWNRMQESIGV